MEDDYECQCPDCLAARGFKTIPHGDFVAVAKLVGQECLPALQAIADRMFLPDWNGGNLSKSTFLMICAAALFREATAQMAEQNGGKLSPSEMLIGMKTFSMMCDCTMEIGPAGIALFGEAEDGGATVH